MRGQLSPFLDDSTRRLSLSGPHLLVQPSGAEDLGLVLHELATNASKYGALSVPEGRIEIAWDLRTDQQGRPLFIMVWREHDGPPVAPPARTGFGSTVIRDMLAMTKKAEITLDYAVTGFAWKLQVVADRMLESVSCTEPTNPNTNEFPSRPDAHSYDI